MESIWICYFFFVLISWLEAFFNCSRLLMQPVPECEGTKFVWCPTSRCTFYGSSSTFEVSLLVFFLILVSHLLLKCHCLAGYSFRKKIKVSWIFFLNLYFSRLETLTLGKGHLSDAFFQDLSELPALMNLSICDSALGGGINEATIQHDRLHNLHIVKCRSHRIAVRLAFKFSFSLFVSVIKKKKWC